MTNVRIILEYSIKFLIFAIQIICMNSFSKTGNHLSDNGGIEHIINGLGGPHSSKDSGIGTIKLLPESFNNVWKSEK